MTLTVVCAAGNGPILIFISVITAFATPLIAASSSVQPFFLDLDNPIDILGASRNIVRTEEDVVKKDAKTLVDVGGEPSIVLFDDVRDELRKKELEAGEELENGTRMPFKREGRFDSGFRSETELTRQTRIESRKNRYLESDWQREREQAIYPSVNRNYGNVNSASSLLNEDIQDKIKKEREEEIQREINKAKENRETILRSIETKNPNLFSDTKLKPNRPPQNTNSFLDTKLTLNINQQPEWMDYKSEERMRSEEIGKIREEDRRRHIFRNKRRPLSFQERRQEERRVPLQTSLEKSENERRQTLLRIKEENKKKNKVFGIDYANERYDNLQRQREGDNRNRGTSERVKKKTILIIEKIPVPVDPSTSSNEKKPIWRDPHVYPPDISDLYDERGPDRPYLDRRPGRPGLTSEEETLLGGYPNLAVGNVMHVEEGIAFGNGQSLIPLPPPPVGVAVGGVGSIVPVVQPILNPNIAAHLALASKTATANKINELNKLATLSHIQNQVNHAVVSSEGNRLNQANLAHAIQESIAIKAATNQQAILSNAVREQAVANAVKNQAVANAVNEQAVAQAVKNQVILSEAAKQQATLEQQSLDRIILSEAAKQQAALGQHSLLLQDKITADAATRDQVAANQNIDFVKLVLKIGLRNALRDRLRQNLKDKIETSAFLHNLQTTKENLIRRLLLLRPYFLSPNHNEFVLPDVLPQIPVGVGITETQISSLPKLHLQPIKLLDAGFRIPHEIHIELQGKVDIPFVEYVLRLPEPLFIKVFNIAKKDFLLALFPRLYRETVENMHFQPETPYYPNIPQQNSGEESDNKYIHFIHEARPPYIQQTIKHPSETHFVGAVQPQVLFDSIHKKDPGTIVVTQPHHHQHSGEIHIVHDPRHPNPQGEISFINEPNHHTHSGEIHIIQPNFENPSLAGGVHVIFDPSDHRPPGNIFVQDQKHKKHSEEIHIVHDSHPLKHQSEIHFVNPSHHHKPSEGVHVFYKPSDHKLQGLGLHHPNQHGHSGETSVIDGIYPLKKTSGEIHLLHAPHPHIQHGEILVIQDQHKHKHPSEINIHHHKNTAEIPLPHLVHSDPTWQAPKEHDIIQQSTLFPNHVGTQIPLEESSYVGYDQSSTEEGSYPAESKDFPKLQPSTEKTVLPVASVSSGINTMPKGHDKISTTISSVPQTQLYPQLQTFPSQINSDESMYPYSFVANIHPLPVHTQTVTKTISHSIITEHLNHSTFPDLDEADDSSEFTTVTPFISGTDSGIFHLTTFNPTFPVTNGSRFSTTKRPSIFPQITIQPVRPAFKPPTTPRPIITTIHTTNGKFSTILTTYDSIEPTESGVDESAENNIIDTITSTDFQDSDDKPFTFSTESTQDPIPTPSITGETSSPIITTFRGFTGNVRQKSTFEKLLEQDESGNHLTRSPGTDANDDEHVISTFQKKKGNVTESKTVVDHIREITRSFNESNHDSRLVTGSSSLRLSAPPFNNFFPNNTDSSNELTSTTFAIPATEPSFINTTPTKNDLNEDISVLLSSEGDSLERTDSPTAATPTKKPPMPRQIRVSSLPLSSEGFPPIPEGFPLSGPSPGNAADLSIESSIGNRSPAVGRGLLKLPDYLKEAPSCSYGEAVNRSFCLYPDGYDSLKADVISDIHKSSIEKFFKVLQEIPEPELDLEIASKQIPNLDLSVTCETQQRLIQLSWARDIIGSWFVVLQTPYEQKVTVTTCGPMARAKGCRPLLHPRPLVAFHPLDENAIPYVLDFPLPVGCVFVSV